MGEPLSAIASVIGICTAAVQASATVVGLVRSIKDAPREIQTILTDLEDFKGVVANLNLTLQDRAIQDVVRGDSGLTDAVKSVAPPLTTCATEMTLLKARIAKIVRSPNNQGGQQRINSATWYWRKTAVFESMSRLQSNKLNLNIALSSIVSYCTLRSYANDPRTLASSVRRNSTDTDAGSALKQYAASVTCDDSSIVACEGPADRDPIAVEASKESSGVNDELEEIESDDTRTDKLLAAVKCNNHVLVEEFIAQGTGIRSGDADGRTPLHVGAELGSYDAVAVLLNNGADPNAKIFEGYLDKGATPLHLAARKRNKDICWLLIFHGADMDALTYNTMRTPLSEAIYNGEVELVKMFIRAGADIESEGKDGFRPLHEAIVSQDLEIFRYLLEAGAKVDSRTAGGYQAIHVVSGLATSKALFLERNKTYMYEPSILILNALLDFGADLDSQLNEGRQSPLMLAAASGNVPGIEILLSRGANVSARDEFGYDFLWYAKEIGMDLDDQTPVCIERWLKEHPNGRLCDAETG